MSNATVLAILALVGAVGWLVALVALWIAFHGARLVWRTSEVVNRHNAAHARAWCCDLEQRLYLEAWGGPESRPEERAVMEPEWPS